MKLNYKFKITKTYNYYGWPQSERHYTIESKFFTMKIRFYGNQGWGVPTVEYESRCNGMMWSYNGFMRDFYKGELDQYFRMREGESVEFEREY